jgi:hypothetical protein
MDAGVKSQGIIIQLLFKNLEVVCSCVPKRRADDRHAVVAGHGDVGVS